MHDKPEALDLLTAAHQEFVNKLMPGLTPEQRRLASQISHALGVVERASNISELAGRAALQRLRSLGAHAPSIHEALDASASRPLEAQLEAGNIALKAAIRAGVFDEDDRARRELTHHLALFVEDRLRVSDPRKLA